MGITPYTDEPLTWGGVFGGTCCLPCLSVIEQRIERKLICDSGRNDFIDSIMLHSWYYTQCESN